MKTTLVPMLCSVALAIMAGAGASHFFSVKQIASFAQMSQSGELQGILPPSAPQGDQHAQPADTRSLIAALEKQNRSLKLNLNDKQTALAQSKSGNPPSGSSIASAVDKAGDGQLKGLVSQLVAQNRDLQNQIAETNRDLMQVQFRFDTLDGKFRPLNLAEETQTESQFDDSIGVLPPLDIP